MVDFNLYDLSYAINSCLPLTYGTFLLLLALKNNLIVMPLRDYLPSVSRLRDSMKTKKELETKQAERAKQNRKLPRQDRPMAKV